MASDFFSSIMERIFPERKEEVGNVPLVNEALERNAKYKEAYDTWLGSGRYKEMLDLLRNQKELAHLRGRANEALQVYESKQSNGFYFNTHMGFEKREFQFLLDRFRDVALGLGYTLQLAERRFSEKANGVHCMERYYLKPELSRNLNPPIAQLYGNVHLELILLNEVPSYLKVMAHVYQDRSYKPPRPFDDFAGLLFGE
jgi:hypothetical protein